MSSENLAALIQAVSLGPPEKSAKVNLNEGNLPKPNKTPKSKPRNNRRKGNRSNQPPNAAKESSLPNTTKPPEGQFKSHLKTSQISKNNPLSTSAREPSHPISPSQQDGARRGLPPNTLTGPKKCQLNSSSEKSSSPLSTKQLPDPPSLYIVQYQPRFHSAANCDILFGVFTSLSAATACAETCCAGMHGQPGINGAIEYGLLDGTMKVLPKAFHMGGKEGLMGASRIEGGEGNRFGDTGRMSSLDGASPVRGEGVVEGMVYLAADRRCGGQLFCVGGFTEKHEAWEACLEYKSQLAYCCAVKDERRWVDEFGMPHVRGKIEGSGVHHWFVRMHALDEMVRSMPGLKGLTISDQ